jgi:hypothetical protein
VQVQNARNQSFYTELGAWVSKHRSTLKTKDRDDIAILWTEEALKELSLGALCRLPVFRHVKLSSRSRRGSRSQATPGQHAAGSAKGTATTQGSRDGGTGSRSGGGTRQGQQGGAGGDAQEVLHKEAFIAPKQMATWLSVVRQKLASRTRHQRLQAAKQQQQQREGEQQGHGAGDVQLRNLLPGLMASDLSSLLTSLTQELLDFQNLKQHPLRPQYTSKRSARQGDSSAQGVREVAVELQGVMHQVVAVLTGPGGRQLLEAAALHELSRVLYTVPLLVHVSGASWSADEAPLAMTDAGQAPQVASDSVSATKTNVPSSTSLDGQPSASAVQSSPSSKQPAPGANTAAGHSAAQQWFAHTCQLVVQQIDEQRVGMQQAPGHLQSTGDVKGPAGASQVDELWYGLLQAAESAVWLPARADASRQVVKQVHALLVR